MIVPAPAGSRRHDMTKQILILANSIKRQQRCVAGRELLGSEGGTPRIGGWVRPIDPSQPEGAIPSWTACVGSQSLAPFDVVEVPLAGSANDPFHPEDWTIVPGIPWRRLGRLGKEVLEEIPGESGDLWGLGSAESRRVLPNCRHSTLRLLKGAERIRAAAWKMERAGREAVRSMLYFTKGGVEHQFTIDDPRFGSRHQVAAAVKADGRWTIELNPAKTVVVASLTLPFNGFHYKVAATIIEL